MQIRCLGPLADNGGPTMTHALLAGSPAINAGDPAAMASMGGVPQFDQRGAPFTRVSGGRIDIGAIERQPIPAAVFGDYNQNGVVDAADYVVWRNTLGTTGVPAYSGADGDGDTTIDQDDYGVWRAHFGQTVPAVGAGSGAGQASSVVSQEPQVVPLSERGIPTDEVGESVVPTRTETMSPFTNSNAAAARAISFAALETRSRGHESTSRSRSSLHRFELSEASGHDPSLLLATDRLSPSLRQDSFVNDDCGIGAHRIDDDDSESEIDEPLAVALTEWP